MASGPITSWKIDGETMEPVTGFIFLGSKITADGDCSHEIKRHLTNLDSILKSRDITLLTKVCTVKKGRKEVKWLSHVWLFASPWTVAFQVPLSMGFSRQEYRSGLPFPSPVAFPEVTYECESWTIRKTEHWWNDTFKLWCWRRLLRGP